VTALADKVVMVTGVAKGCGKVLAEAFAADRAKVVGCDIDVDAGRATAAAVRAAGGEMTFVEADVADDAAVQELVAMTVLTKAAAIEVAKDNISVNSLAFAAIDIPGDMVWRFLDSQGIPAEQLVSMFPIGRMGRPEELVAAVRYLCSDDARYMTGTMLVLDGGYTAQ
jgi:NAD(P)-dependent dehydrogenase (short-subunit alcohol dehydrogenase family)